MASINHFGEKPFIVHFAIFKGEFDDMTASSVKNPFLPKK